MTDDEIIQYLDTIESVYTDHLENRGLCIRKKWDELNAEAERLNLLVNNKQHSDNVNCKVQIEENNQKDEIRKRLEILQEETDKLKNEQLVLSFKAQMKGYRQEWKRIKQIPRNQIEDIQKQIEILNILDNKCLQLQEAIKLVQQADILQSFSLGFGDVSILRGYWEDAIDAVSLTTADGTVFCPEGKRQTKNTDSTQNADNHPLAVFHSEKNLSFKEITISVDPEKLMIRISARNKKASISFAKLGLMKLNDVAINKQGEIFLTVANGSFSPDEVKVDRAITRLSKILRDALQIKRLSH